MLWLWLGFLVLVIAFLALDLGVFHRRPHALGVAEALSWSAFWIVLALAFCVFVYFAYERHWLGAGIGPQAAPNGKAAMLQYLTGYLIEKSLSMDNIFVIALIFSYFGVEPRYQHRVLFWGILGALLLRGAMIIGGVALIRWFEWVIYLFGALVLFAAVRMAMHKGEKVHPDKNVVIRVARRFWPVSATFEEHRFVSVDRDSGRRMLTPLAIALITIESTDVMFAIDSIPAVFAVSRDPFIVFTSNVFAILGLRSLYFALAAMLMRFKLLRYSLIGILGFVGIKMLLTDVVEELPTSVSLIVVGMLLSGGIVASLVASRGKSTT